MSIRTDRLGNIFVEEISKLLMTEIKDDDIGFVTINAVRVSPDLSSAKVYFTTLDEDKAKTLNALKRASGFIRSKLADIVEIRKMPELTFIYDETTDYGNRIEEVLESIKEKE